MVGKIVVVQTMRNNQVAFLRRLPDENNVPAVQVIIIKHITHIIAKWSNEISQKYISCTGDLYI